MILNTDFTFYSYEPLGLTITKAVLPLSLRVREQGSSSSLSAIRLSDYAGKWLNVGEGPFAEEHNTQRAVYILDGFGQKKAHLQPASPLLIVTLPGN